MPWINSDLPGSDRIVPPSGTGRSQLMFFGEAAGEKERQQLRPFVETAPAGSILARAFRHLGMERNDQTITNTVWWQPPNNYLDGAPWQAACQAHCRQWNIDLINRVRPKVLVALGKIAFHELTGLYDVDISQGRGFVIKAKPEYNSLPVIGTYHPSYIVRGSKRKNEETGAKTEKMSGGGWGFYSILIRDLQLAKHLISNDIQPDQLLESPNVNLYGHRQDWEEVIRLAKANPQFPISYDFETPLSTVVTDESEFESALGNITQFQVSLYPGHALVSSWDPTLLPLIKELLELPNPKLDWNGRGFDRKILRDLQVRVDNSYIDVMWMWHHYQRDWPMGLQFATSFVSPADGPWKHTFHQDLRPYGARDVHEPQKIYEFLKRWMTGRASVDGRDVYSCYRRQILLYQNTVFDPLQRRGAPIDNDRREKLDQVLGRIEEQVTEELQDLVPEEIKPVKQKEGLKDLPKEWQEQIKAEEQGNAEDLAQQELERGEKKRKVTKALIAKHLKARIAKRLEEIEVLQINRWESPSGKIYVRRLLEQASGKPQMRWAELEDFNPNSSPQLLAYIQHKRDQEIQNYAIAKGHRYDNLMEAEAAGAKKATYRIPVTFKDKRPTTGKKELDRLIERTHDPVLSKCIEVKEMTKMRGTYIGKQTPAGPTGWAPHPDGRVHPFYNDGPATGQAAASGPNSLNFPKHLTRALKQADAEFLQLIPPGLDTNDYAKNPVPLGKAVRSMIAAPPGHRLVAADYRAFHVLTTGYEAKDESYMRLAKLDMHSFFAATQLLNLAYADDLLKLSDKDLAGQLEEFKKDKTPRYHVPGFQDLQPFQFVRNKMAKPAILGYGFGLQANHLYHDNQEFIRSLEQAKRLLKGLDELFPITHRWRKEIVYLADRQGGYLISKHGYIRHFNCLVDRFPVEEGHRIDESRGEKLVMDRSGQFWCYAPGDDNEACIAFLPANDAFGMIREGHLRLTGYMDWYNPVQTGPDWCEELGFIIPLHDENVFCCPTEKVDKLLELLHSEMTRPSEVLLLPDGQGLKCDVEFQISPDGGSWAQMKDLKI